MARRKKKLELGDKIEVELLDHTSHDEDGWVNAKKASTYGPALVTTRGYYINEDKDILRLAFMRGDNDYSVIFTILKKAITKITREQ